MDYVSASKSLPNKNFEWIMSLINTVTVGEESKVSMTYS